ncbi:MAG: DUF6056 family protein [Oscillospiraceae bacterium]|nr:DUF6056 family protein [Oscillospiraceae bacterium]
MEEAQRQKLHRQVASLLALCLFLVSILPIFITGLHARPALDDYLFTASSSFLPNAEWWTEVQYREHYFERSVRYAVLNGNVFDMGQAVLRTVADNYMDWQGTFTAIALFSMQPGVFFGPDAYPLTMLVTIFSLMFATAFLLKTVLGKQWLIPCLLLLTGSIQFLPHIGQGFFWYNGAVFYVFFYSLMLTSLTCKIRLLRGKGRRVPLKIGLIALLDFLIGGGNLVTALTAVLINGIFLLVLLWQNRGKLKGATRRWAPQLIFTGAAILGLLINVMAPGNMVRNQGEFAGISHVIWSVYTTFPTAIADMMAWTTPAMVFLLALTAPFLWRAAKDMKFTFPLPLLVLLLSFVLFASQNAPPLFGQHFPGPPRLRNIVYFSYVLFLFGNLFYLLGWLSRNVKLRRKTPLVPRRLFVPVCLGLLAAFVLTGYAASTTWATFSDLRAGRPQQFVVEHNERLALLEGPAPVVTVSAYSDPPLSLIPWWDGQDRYLWTELGINPQFLVNRAMADYFGKEYVYSTPPPRARALPVLTSFRFGDRAMALETYLINDNRYFRLRDFGYFLESVFDVTFEEAQFMLWMGRPYAIVGGEARIRPDNIVHKAAYFYRDTLLVDGIPAFAVAYFVEGERFFRMADVLDLVNLEFDLRYGIFHLSERVSP